MKLNEVKAPAIDPNTPYGRNKIEYDSYMTKINAFKKKLRDLHKQAQDLVRQTAVRRGIVDAETAEWPTLNNELRKMYDKGIGSLVARNVYLSRRRSQQYFVSRRSEQDIADINTECRLAGSNIRILTRHAKPYVRALKGAHVPSSAPRGLPKAETPIEQRKILEKKMRNVFRHIMLLKLAMIRSPDAISVGGGTFQPLKDNAIKIPEIKTLMDFLEKCAGNDNTAYHLRKYLDRNTSTRLRMETEIETKNPGDLDPLYHRFQFFFDKFKTMMKHHNYLSKLIRQEELNRRGW